jgi:predicted porin
MKLRKTQLAAAVGAALLVGGTAVQAQNLQVQLYGQVNRALMFADDEFSSKVFHVDGQPSSTRFGIQGTSQVMPGLRAGARIETEMKSNPSDVVTFAAASEGAVGTTTGTNIVTFAERWLDLWFEGNWGRVNIGQGSGAADDASTLDLSGTGLANGSCLCDWGGALSFRTSTGAAITSVGSVINNNDFESRYDRAMYTTPVFGGFRAQVGFGQKSDTGEATEASLWYSGKLAGELQAAVGWSKVSPTATGLEPKETIGGSIAWLHTSGLNLAYNFTQVDLPVATGAASQEATYNFFKVGYKFGPHAISLAYALGEDQVLGTLGDEATGYGLGYVWTPIRWAEIYANYIMFSLDHTRAGVGSASDVNVAAVGTRIRF